MPSLRVPPCKMFLSRLCAVLVRNCNLKKRPATHSLTQASLPAPMHSRSFRLLPVTPTWCPTLHSALRSAPLMTFWEQTFHLALWFLFSDAQDGQRDARGRKTLILETKKHTNTHISTHAYKWTRDAHINWRKHIHIYKCIETLPKDKKQANYKPMSTNR